MTLIFILPDALTAQEKEVEYKLLTCLCTVCKEEAIDDIKERYATVDMMMSTVCGCEYQLEEIEND